MRDNQQNFKNLIQNTSPNASESDMMRLMQIQMKTMQNQEEDMKDFMKQFMNQMVGMQDMN